MSSRYLRANVAYPWVPGSGVCRVCGQPARGKTCGPSCAREVAFIRDIGSQRFAVYQRDAGVCVLCSIDTKKLDRVLGHAFKQLGWRSQRWLPGGIDVKYRDAILRSLGFDGDCRPLWEMDHVLPVCQGGGVQVGMRMAEAMANLRTLCVPCHKARPKPKRRVA